MTAQGTMMADGITAQVITMADGMAAQAITMADGMVAQVITITAGRKVQMSMVTEKPIRITSIPLLPASIAVLQSSPANMHAATIAAPRTVTMQNGRKCREDAGFKQKCVCERFSHSQTHYIV